MALTGTETLYVLPTQSNGQPAATTQLTTVSEVASANTMNGSTRVATQLSKTADTTLANIPNLVSPSLVAGGVYRVTVWLPTTSGASGGAKIALATPDTLTLTSSNIGARFFTATGVATTSTTSGLASALGSTAAVTFVEITATFVVNAAGTFTVQFAQNVSDATASIALVNGSMVVTRIA